MLDTNVPKLRVEGPIPFTRSNFLHTSSKFFPAVQVTSFANSLTFPVASSAASAA